MATEKIFNDSVHGHIKMHPLLVEIIDTPEFQRLRNIKQLGGGYFVFPGASHNRFEHSIGVADLAGELVRSLKAQGCDITDEEELSVQIAGLCHDLGHGPYSHVFEVFMKEVNGSKWKHEKASVTMFEHLITNKTKTGEKTIEDLMKDQYKLDLDFIKDLIFSSDEKQSKTKYKEKPYLYEIVANELTGIDVDKMDYFSRDCLHLGMKSNFSHERYVMFARVCTNEKGVKQICMRDKEALNMYELFHVRYLLHHNVYQHRVKVAVETMIVDALKAAEDDFQINGKKISAAVNDHKIYLTLTDDILQTLKQSSANARPIIEKIEKRELYRFIGDKIFKPEEINDLSTAEQKKEVLMSWLRCIQKPENSAEHFRIRVITIDYGKQHKNPINSLKFYSKDDKDNAKPLSANEISYIQPTIFRETKVMLFYTAKLVPDLSGEAIERFWEKIKKS